MQLSIPNCQQTCAYYTGQRIFILICLPLWRALQLPSARCSVRGSSKKHNSDGLNSLADKFRMLSLQCVLCNTSRLSARSRARRQHRQYPSSLFRATLLGLLLNKYELSPPAANGDLRYHTKRHKLPILGCLLPRRM